jgi:hypothetical protein
VHRLRVTEWGLATCGPAKGLLELRADRFEIRDGWIAEIAKFLAAVRCAPDLSGPGVFDPL